MLLDSFCRVKLLDVHRFVDAEIYSSLVRFDYVFDYRHVYVWCYFRYGHTTRIAQRVIGKHRKLLRR